MCKHTLPAQLSVFLHFSELMKLSENTLVSFLSFPTAACVRNLRELLLSHRNTEKDVNYRSSDLPFVGTHNSWAVRADFLSLFDPFPGLPPHALSVNMRSLQGGEPEQIYLQPNGINR